MDRSDRPSFITLWLELILDELKARQWGSILPLFLIPCFGIGLVFGWCIPLTNNPSGRSNLIALYSGLIAAQGIVLALSLSSMQHIYSNISEKHFARFLREEGIIEHYLFFVQYIPAVGVVSLVLAVLAGVALLFNFDLYIIRIMLALSMGGFLYSTKQSMDTSVLVRDLIWYRSLFAARDVKGQSQNPERMDYIPNIVKATWPTPKQPQGSACRTEKNMNHLHRMDDVVPNNGEVTFGCLARTEKFAVRLMILSAWLMGYQWSYLQHWERKGERTGRRKTANRTGVS